MPLRQMLVRLHRWVGLAIAGFLVVAGLTGSVIAFNHELDEWLNPELFKVQGQEAAQPPLALAGQVASEEPAFRVTYVPLHVEPGHALVLGLTSRDTAIYRQVFVDPVSGSRLGERDWGACCLERKHLIPFLYSVHYTLHLPGVWGLWVMGIVGMAWAVDCFVGFALTLPPPKAPGAPFWQRWRPAWRIKFDANVYRINFDVHRAGGLWAWGLLLMLAVTGVSLSLPYDVVRPLLTRVTTLAPSPFDPASAVSAVDARVPMHAVLARAETEAAKRGWDRPFDIFHSPEFNMYSVGFGDHHVAGLGVPHVYVDAGTGEIRAEAIPGEGGAGDIFMQWMFPLHSGQAAGLIGRVLVSMTGVAVATLSVTGVVIWSRKRRGREALAQRQRAA